MATGSKITAAGLKAIQDKAERLLGPGVGTSGYGQTVLSTEYTAGVDIIRKSHWDAIRYDIINLRTHQDGVPPIVTSVNRGDLIAYGAGSPNTDYDTFLEIAAANKFKIGPGQFVVTSRGTQSHSSGWQNYAYCVITLTFADSNRARYFFNSGGKVRVASSRTGGSSTSQNTSWTNMLASAGTQEFGVLNNSVNFYTLTDSFQTYYQTSGSTPYSTNKYKLEARTPGVANNSNGTASVIEIRVYFEDLYVDQVPQPVPQTGYTPPASSFPPYDNVDGTITVAVEEVRAAGTMAPEGTFTITPPSYSISLFTAS